MECCCWGTARALLRRGMVCPVRRHASPCKTQPPGLLNESHPPYGTTCSDTATLHTMPPMSPTTAQTNLHAHCECYITSQHLTDSTAQYTHYHQSCAMTAITQSSARGTAHAGNLHTHTTSRPFTLTCSPRHTAHSSADGLNTAARNSATATGPTTRKHPTIRADAY